MSNRPYIAHAEMQPEAPAREPRQYVKYTFFQLDPAWRGLPDGEREAHKREFTAALEECLPGFIVLRTYNLIAMRADSDFGIWSVSETLEEQSALLSRLYTTSLAPYLRVAHSYLAMTKRSQYVRDHHHEGQEGNRLTVLPGGAKYLFVYPFVKTRAWYALSFDERHAMMREHIKVGHKYPTVKINTSYSFGLDDQEFVVAFESDYPDDFLDLVMELRESRASSYTLRDTPIFTCIAQDIRHILDAFGGAKMALSSGGRAW